MTTQALVRKTGLLATLAESWARYRQRRAQINELRAMASGELGRLAQDAGVSCSDLIALAGRDGNSAELLGRRMAEAGLDQRRIDPAVLRDLQRCCSQCGSKQLCAHELEDRPKSAAWPRYCPNEQTLSALTDTKCH
jgi:uncharacterized protein YjiS (DUF1127 family)